MKILQIWSLCESYAVRLAILGEINSLIAQLRVLMIYLSHAGLIIQMTTALQLEGLVTKKPRVSKYTMKPQAVNKLQDNSRKFN